MEKKKIIKEASYAHSDLNLFASIETLLEGGHLYQSESQLTAEKIIKICKAEQQKCLRAHDAAIRAIYQTEE